MTDNLWMRKACVREQHVSFYPYKEHYQIIVCFTLPFVVYKKHNTNSRIKLIFYMRLQHLSITYSLRRCSYPPPPRLLIFITVFTVKKKPAFAYHFHHHYYKALFLITIFLVCDFLVTIIISY